MLELSASDQHFPSQIPQNVETKQNMTQICCPWLCSRENFQNYAFCSKIFCQKGLAHGFLCPVHLGYTHGSCRRWGVAGTESKGRQESRGISAILPAMIQHHFPCATTSHGAVFRMVLAVLGARCLTSARASLTGAEQCGVGSLASRFRAEAALRAQHRLPASW